jgi:hypothetical protein
MTMPTHQEHYETAIAALADSFRDSIVKQAIQVNVTEDALTKAVVGELLGEERVADGRAHEWRIRLRLYDLSRPHDPQADTDPNLSPELPGTMIVRGLPAIAKLIADHASAFHGAACAGLETTVLKRRIKSLRTQLSNRGEGTGTMTVDYEVQGRIGSRYMTARCDVQRIERGVTRFKPS